MTPDIFDEIDRLVNLDLGGRKNWYLYRSARSSKPLSLRSARMMKDSIKGGEVVMITSGFPILPDNNPETDGPPGAVLLARAIEEMGGVPVFALDEISEGVHRALIEKVGLERGEVRKVPVGLDKAREECSALLREYHPQLLISVERPGMNEKGLYHNMSGDEVTGLVGKVGFLFTEALERDIPTIGIGDGGNEIGMGNISESVRRHIPHGDSIAAETKVDSLIVSAVSNWGAYGLLTALSMITERSLIHDPEMERELIEACIESGAVDGVDGGAKYSVDGIPGRIHENVVEILSYISERVLSE